MITEGELSRGTSGAKAERGATGEGYIQMHYIIALKCSYVKCTINIYKENR